MFNHRFTLVPPPPGARTWFDELRCQTQFTDTGPISPSQVYYTQTGPSVGIAMQVYGPTHQNITLALHRLLCVRVPGTPGLCATLYADQSRWLQHPDLVSRMNEWRNRLCTLTTEYAGALREEELHYADPHPKRLPRIHAYLSAQAQGGINNVHQRCFRRRVEGKLKVEVARWGKIPRLVIDLRVPASLLGFRLAWHLKHAIAKSPVVDEHMWIEFIPSASYPDLTRAFQLLHKPPRPYTMVCFSDDAALVITTPQGRTYYDMDISSCDKSHAVTCFAHYSA